MTWRRIDDSFDVHPKVEALRELGPKRFSSAIALWTLAGCHASRGDGTFSRTLAGRLGVSRWSQAVLDLSSVCLLKDLGKGIYGFHDWDDYNETEGEKSSKRKANAERQRRFREKKTETKEPPRNALLTTPRTRTQLTNPPDPPQRNAATTLRGSLIRGYRDRLEVNTGAAYMSHGRDHSAWDVIEKLCVEQARIEHGDANVIAGRVLDELFAAQGWARDHKWPVAHLAKQFATYAVPATQPKSLLPDIAGENAKLRTTAGAA